jgi:hypothetical protein
VLVGVKKMGKRMEFKLLKCPIKLMNVLIYIIADCYVSKHKNKE